MSSFRITPSRLCGELTIPASKSHTLRAILFAMMGKGKSVIRHYLHSADTEAMLQAISQFGAKVNIFPDALEIEGVSGKLEPAEDVIQAGNSGLVLRLIGAIAALLPSYTVITGDYSIRHHRPVKPLLQALQQLGACAFSTRGDDHAPIIIRGPMHATQDAFYAELCGADSQPVSALLIACSFLPKPTHLTVSNPGEKPWIDLTLSWLSKLKMRVEQENYENYTIFGSGAYEGFDVTIPGDMSSAAYPIAAALITDSELTVHNVDMNDVQGDKQLITILKRMGAHIDIDEHSRKLTVRRGGILKGESIDINDCIDMITILPVIACFAKGETQIHNAGISRSKESDRIACIAQELTKMGAEIQETPDGLIISPSLLSGAHMHTHRDHRMALALSVAAFAARGESVIEDTECIAKTYPSFKTDLNAVGACIA